MELSVINIGNSKGVRLPKTILERYHIGEKIDLIFEKGYIILKPKPEPRKGWAKSFTKMYENGDDQLLMEDVFGNENFDK